MEKKKHISLRAIIAFALILGVLIPVLNGVVVPVSAAEGSSAPLELSSVIHVDGDGGSVLTSAIDAINLWRKSTSLGTSGRLAVKIPMNGKVLSDIEEFYVRMSNPHTDTTYSRDVDFCLVDHNNVMYGWRADGSDVTSGSKGYRAAVIKEGNPGIPGNCGTVEANTRNFWADKVYANAEYWYIHKVSEWQQRTENTAGFATQAGQSFDSTNVKYVVFQVPMDLTSLNLNIGQIWGKKSDGTFEKLFDPITNTAEITMYSTSTGENTSDYQLTTMHAGEVVVPASASANSAMRVVIPRDISQYNVVSYEVDLTGCASDLFMNKYVADYSDGKKEVWYSNGAFAMFYPDPGTKFYNEKGASYSDNSNVIPAGFKGKIEVVLSTFTTNPGNETKDNVMDLSKANDERLGFTIQPKGSYPFTGSFILKNVKLVSGAEVGNVPYKIVIANKPNKLQYTVGEIVDTTGLSVNLCYSNGQKETLADDAYTVSTPDMSTAGTKKVTVTYGEMTASFDIAVSLIKKVQKIEIGKTPNKVEYTVGDTFDKTGLVVNLCFENGMKDTLPVNAYKVSAPDMSKTGTKTVTVTYGNMSASFDITVSEKSATPKKAEKIEIATMPTKVKYTVGETFNKAGLSVNLCYNNGEKETLAAYKYSISTPKMSTAGTKKVTVIYGTMTTSFDITVSAAKKPGSKNTNSNETPEDETTPIVDQTEPADMPAEETRIPEKIEVTTMPDKVEYIVGDVFTTKGLDVTLRFGNGEEAVLTDDAYTVSSPDMNTAGTKIVTVTYGDMTASFDITVAEEKDGGIGVGVVIGIIAAVLLVAALIVVWIWQKKRVKV